MVGIGLLRRVTRWCVRGACFTTLGAVASVEVVYVFARGGGSMGLLCRMLVRSRKIFACLTFVSVVVGGLPFISLMKASAVINVLSSSERLGTEQWEGNNLKVADTRIARVSGT